MKRSSIVTIGSVLVSILIVGVTVAWFSFTCLSFSPVPWPDGSAFYLPSLSLLAWPPRWVMHSQAAFIPSYDIANFNMMPLLPALLGIGMHLGLGKLLGATLAIKFISLLGLGIWAWMLGYWTWRLTQSILLSFILGLVALWDPICRWGTLVVRSEIWIGLLWLMILMELHAFQSEDHSVLRKDSRRFWLISLWLALAAYFHFEAIILVPATSIGLFKIQNNLQKELKNWIKRLFAVGLRTSLFLIPWGVYILAHPSLFLEQMGSQFSRLSGINSWIANPYLFFHSLFLSIGNPEGLPKFFNLAKGFFWLMVILLSGHFLYFFVLMVNKKIRSENRNQIELFLAAGVAFWTSLYLWCSKPEVWFITLCHLTLWPWLAIFFMMKLSRSSTFSGFSLGRFCVGAYAVLSLAANISIQFKMPASYSWSAYSQWVDCIERVAGDQSKKHPLRVWQTSLPDVLVELSFRHPSWDLTRFLDFSEFQERAWDFLEKTDLIIMSRFGLVLSGLNGDLSIYEGPQRLEDPRYLLEDPLRSFVTEMILKRLPSEQPNQWIWRVCHVGPFFADIAYRNSRSDSISYLRTN